MKLDENPRVGNSIKKLSGFNYPEIYCDAVEDVHTRPTNQNGSSSVAFSSLSRMAHDIIEPQGPFSLTSRRLSLSHAHPIAT